MSFAELVAVSAALSDTRSRKRKTALVAELLAPVDECDAFLAACYLTGTLPQGRIGIGYRTVQAHLTSVDGPPTASTLTLAQLDQTLDALANLRGAGSQAARGEALSALGAQLSSAERDYLARLFVGEVRHGALEGVLADAIAQAYQLELTLVRRAAMLGGDLPSVARLASRGDHGALAAARLRLLQPVQPMLAQSAKDIDDALDRCAHPVFESKLDGARVQIHRQGEHTKVFTRQLHDVTGAVPELVEWARARPTPTFIVEGEAIALRPQDGRPLPFQHTMKRFGRRLDVAAMRESIPLSLRLFDCLHLDGDDLIDEPLRERLLALSALAQPGDQVARLESGDREAVGAFVDRVLADGHEGVMAKDLEAPYAAGRRGGAWLKLKPTHTADLVLIGCEWGSGRREGMMSNLRLAASDGCGGFVMVGKTFKGLTDEVLRWQTEHLPPLAQGHDALGIDLPPRIVYEIAFDGVQASPQYPGGLALRFARYRRRRDDKAPQDATPLAELRALLPSPQGST
ncbi:MAG: ATP-dependent DNA ligase [Pseudomonadota bacterium]